MTGQAHAPAAAPSSWILRWAPLVPAGAAVLDVACGAGRHARLFASRGHPVTAVDRDPVAGEMLADEANVRFELDDLETGRWSAGGRRFGAVVVANYLHRPLFPALLDALAPGGVLVYETFAAGNERFGRPSNPDFLLQPGELLDRVRGRLRVLAYEDLEVSGPKPAMVQRICARAG